MRSVTIRPVFPDDAAAVALLAALDSAPPPRGDLLIGLVDDEPWAVLSLADGRAVADPFRPSAGVVTLLRERARLLGETKRAPASAAITAFRAARWSGRVRHP